MKKRAVAAKRPEEFLISVSYHRSPEPRVRRGDVMADMGFACPNPPPTDAEMQHVAFAAKMAMAKVLCDRKSRKPAASKRSVRRNASVASRGEPVDLTGNCSRCGGTGNDPEFADCTCDCCGGTGNET